MSWGSRASAVILGGAGHDGSGTPRRGSRYLADLQRPRIPQSSARFARGDVVLPLVEKYGKTSRTCEYLGKINGHWMAMPTAYASRACVRAEVTHFITEFSRESLLEGDGFEPSVPRQ